MRAVIWVSYVFLGFASRAKSAEPTERDAEGSVSGRKK